MISTIIMMYIYDYDKINGSIDILSLYLVIYLYSIQTLLSLCAFTLLMEIIIRNSPIRISESEMKDKISSKYFKFSDFRTLSHHQQDTPDQPLVSLQRRQFLHQQQDKPQPSEEISKNQILVDIVINKPVSSLSTLVLSFHQYCIDENFT